MWSKLLALFPFLVLSAMSTGCATRYQDLLRDRDAEIRELNGRLADAGAENESLRRTNDDLRGQLASRAVPMEASAGDDELARIGSELSGLDVSRRFGLISIGIDNTVTFDSGSTSLKPSAASVLKQVADLLRRDYADRRIYVAGHTDTDPIRKTKGLYRSNRHLSAERADAVAAWLCGQGGVSESHVAVIGYGPFVPASPGNSDSAKERNRRVEVMVGEVL